MAKWAKAPVHTDVCSLGFTVAKSNSDVLEWQTNPRNIWLVENECHLQFINAYHKTKPDYEQHLPDGKAKR